MKILVGIATFLAAAVIAAQLVLGLWLIFMARP